MEDSFTAINTDIAIICCCAACSAQISHLLVQGAGTQVHSETRKTGFLNVSDENFANARERVLTFVSKIVLVFLMAMWDRSS